MEFFRQPWAHQLEAIERARQIFSPDPQESGFALFFQPGTGKTATAINILRDQINKNRRLLRTLVFAPQIVLGQWREEFKSNSRIPLEKIVLLNGSGKQRLSKFLAHGFSDDADPVPGIFITNYESLLMGELYSSMKRWQPEAIIFDESHKLKSYNAKRSQLAERLANAGPVIPYKQILTGSPVLKDPMDLFQQFLILDGGQTLGGNFFAFRARFFRDRNAGMPKDRYFPRWEVMSLAKDGFDALAELNRLMGPCSMAVKKSDCLDLPPLVRTTIKVPMSAEQARLYAEMKRDFVTFLNDKACTAMLAITKSLRLVQICSGFIKTVDAVETSLDKNAKQEALTELLADLTPDNKVLVWCVFKQNYIQIRAVCEKLGVGMVEITGEQTPRQKEIAVERFRKDPKVRVLCGHPQSGGVGLNLIEASYSIFYSRNFSLENDIQAEARNYRGGSEELHEKITRIDLVTEGTIDEQIAEALAKKQNIGDQLLRQWVVDEK